VKNLIKVSAAISEDISLALFIYTVLVPQAASDRLLVVLFWAKCNQSGYHYAKVPSHCRLANGALFQPL
jgi:hypothetical protein